MGKTPKKAAPGGDERNLYVRRLKATNLPSKTSETILPERQRESESSNRPKVSGIHKKITPAARKNFKSKLRSPAKLGLSHQTKRLSKPPGTSTQEKQLFVDACKRIPPTDLNMQSESEDAEVRHNESVPKVDSKNEIEKKDNENKEIICNKQDTVTTEGEQQTSSPDIKPAEDGQENKTTDKETKIDGKEKDTESGPSQEIVQTEEHEDNDIKLSLESSESPAKSEEDNNLNDTNIAQEIPIVEEVHVVQKESKPTTNEKEELHSEPQTDTESCSVDIVESTTSEISEASESTAPSDIQKEKTKPEQNANNESFISYDASIMLKEVQVKLNDCLKDNSKLFETSTLEQSSPFQKDVSFGKALRSISGRHSISRMRHVTIRERRFSPNNSLFVNTSSASIPQDEAAECKVLHYSTGLSDTLSTNGSPVERKRKIDSDGWSSAKKQKIESENSLLNTSINLLKGLRRPIQISTPNVESCKYQSDKLNISDISGNEEFLTEQASGTRKWCAIM